MSTAPIEALQLKAIAQRSEIHQTVSDLREKATAVRERMRLSKHAREHFAAASILISLISFAAGYGLAGVFTRD